MHGRNYLVLHIDLLFSGDIMCSITWEVDGRIIKDLSMSRTNPNEEKIYRCVKCRKKVSHVHVMNGYFKINKNGSLDNPKSYPELCEKCYKEWVIFIGGPKALLGLSEWKEKFHKFIGYVWEPDELKKPFVFR